MMPPEGRLTLPPARSMNLRRHTVRSIAILQYDHRRLLSRWRARWPCPRPEPAPAEIAGGVRLGTARSCRGDRSRGHRHLESAIPLAAWGAEIRTTPPAMA